HLRWNAGGRGDLVHGELFTDIDLYGQVPGQAFGRVTQADSEAADVLATGRAGLCRGKGGHESAVPAHFALQLITGPLPIIARVDRVRGSLHLRGSGAGSSCMRIVLDNATRITSGHCGFSFANWRGCRRWRHGVTREGV